MTAMTLQRDLITALKKETILNVGLLSKLRPMPGELARLIFKENALEKPTQNVFNHLSHYLVSIIDSQVCASLSWPLYDTKTERAYRNELSSFISDYCNKGLLAPVMSSYLVNPGCYKVTMLIFQMSQLAVQRMLMAKMTKDSQKKLYSDMTDKYKARNDNDFIENIEKETINMSSKFSNYLCKKRVMEKIAEAFRRKITEMEDKMASVSAQKYLDNIVDNYLKRNSVDENTKQEILSVRNVNQSSKVFDDWLSGVDIKVNALESKWDEKISPFLDLSKQCMHSSQLLLARQTGEADRHSYMIEYNPSTDEICTKELQNQVNSQQKYVLKNIVKEDKLIFPNLIRGFLIAICFILKNTEIGDEIYKFNEYLDGGCRNYKELVTAMKILLERVLNAESRLQPHPTLYNQSISFKEINDIPPLPDLSDLKTGRDFHTQIFDTFTPLNISKHQFNLLRKNTVFAKPQPRSIIAPTYQGPRDDFLKSLISCRVSAYDRHNTTQSLNMTVTSQFSARNNETIAECSSGFTKQQIMRLLSTKKSSSSKKFKYKTERPDINVKKGGLFNESLASVDSNGLYRSYSSPNLYENREKKSRIGKRFAAMQDNCPLLEVSGITALSKDNSFGTPENVPVESSRNRIDATSLPMISITPPPEYKPLNQDCKVHFADLNLADMQEKMDETKTETPKTNSQLIRKTSSLEKIINRFKKVRANVVSDNGEADEFRTIVEEKENMNVDVFAANRVLLPDLLSPSCNALVKKSSECIDDVCIEDEVRRKPRESLGTALGVDHTFLDQFDLID